MQKMWLLTGKNHYAAKLNMMEANQLVEEIKACLQRDQELIDEYHRMENGKWCGMGLSEHIGFIHWNEYECRYPVLMLVMPARKNRLIVSVDGTTQHSEGSSWHVNTLYMNDFRRPDVTKASFTISSVSDLEAAYEITCEAPWLSCSGQKGILDGKRKATERIIVTIDRSKMGNETEALIKVKIPSGVVTIIVDAKQPELSGLPERTFVDTYGYISIEAEHYHAKYDLGEKGEVIKTNGGKKDGSAETEGPKKAAGFQVLDGYGKTLSGVKVFPTTRYFTPGQRPSLEYLFVVDNPGFYVVELYTQPSNPVSPENTIYYGIQVNDREINVYNTIPEGQRVGDGDYQ
ncbi:MAG: hypothetical protein GX081_08000 [Firmicutes bacterium]|nr:hypothetical protein [Bacillota bacterium]